MMEKKYAKAVLAILVVFAIGLVGFYAFSAMYGDGLEKTMQDNGVQEGESQYTAPLDYGGSYGGSLLMGILGFVLVLVVVFGFMVVARNRRTKVE
jgi:cobalt/nickel transport protein